MQQLQKTAAASHKCGQAWIDKSHVSLIQNALCRLKKMNDCSRMPIRNAAYVKL